MFSEYFKQWWVEFSKGELNDEKTDRNISKLLQKGWPYDTHSIYVLRIGILIISG